MDSNAEHVLSYVWATVKALGLLVVVLIIMMAVSWPSFKAKRACEAADGHWVAGPLYGPDECWSKDGTHRLFPEGF